MRRFFFILRLNIPDYKQTTYVRRPQLHPQILRLRLEDRVRPPSCTVLFGRVSVLLQHHALHKFRLFVIFALHFSKMVDVWAVLRNLTLNMFHVHYQNAHYFHISSFTDCLLPRSLLKRCLFVNTTNSATSVFFQRNACRSALT